MYFVYMLRCGDGSFYTGYTNDPVRRTAVHNSGKGAKCTRARLPVQLVYTEPFQEKSAALKREAALKRLTHGQKENLILRR